MVLIVCQERGWTLDPGPIGSIRSPAGGAAPADRVSTDRIPDNRRRPTARQVVQPALAEARAGLQNRSLAIESSVLQFLSNDVRRRWRTEGADCTERRVLDVLEEELRKLQDGDPVGAG